MDDLSNMEEGGQANECVAVGAELIETVRLSRIQRLGFEQSGAAYCSILNVCGLICKKKTNEEAPSLGKCV